MDTPNEKLPPHSLCPVCSHFVCLHPGYPGRHSTAVGCSHMSMVPVTTRHNHIVRCDCLLTVDDLFLKKDRTVRNVGV